MVGLALWTGSGYSKTRSAGETLVREADLGADHTLVKLGGLAPFESRTQALGLDLNDQTLKFYTDLDITGYRILFYSRRTNRSRSTVATYDADMAQATGRVAARTVESFLADDKLRFKPRLSTAREKVYENTRDRLVLQNGAQYFIPRYIVVQE